MLRGIIGELPHAIARGFPHVKDSGKSSVNPVGRVSDPFSASVTRILDE